MVSPAARTFLITEWEGEGRPTSSERENQNITSDSWVEGKGGPDGGSLFTYDWRLQQGYRRIDVIFH